MRNVRAFVRGVTYHLISRFVDREWFIRNDDERNIYLRLLGRALLQSDWRCLAYAVMSSHIHLMVVAGRVPLESWIKRVHPRFATAMNKKYGRIGPMFVRGPKDIGLLPENEPDVLAYIHNNPVRAGVAKFASESTWTSHRAYLGLAAAPPWLHVDDGMRRVGTSDPERFDAWVNVTLGSSGEVELRRIRKEARKRGAIEVATQLAGKVGVVPLVAVANAHLRVDPRRIVELAAAALDLTYLQICSARRDRRITPARIIAAHVARRVGISGSAIATCLGISPQAVSKLRMRDVPAHLNETFAIVLAHVCNEARARLAS
jgi:REP-associated tyrosine transposase